MRARIESSTAHGTGSLRIAVIVLAAAFGGGLRLPTGRFYVGIGLAGTGGGVLNLSMLNPGVVVRKGSGALIFAMLLFFSCAFWTAPVARRDQVALDCKT
jgi:hypothetical protein